MPSRVSKTFFFVFLWSKSLRSMLCSGATGAVLIFTVCGLAVTAIGVGSGTVARVVRGCNGSSVSDGLGDSVTVGEGSGVVSGELGGRCCGCGLGGGAGAGVLLV